MLQVSTGFKTLILGPASFEEIFYRSAIEVYSGPQPASADLAATGTLLGRITKSGLAWSTAATTNGLIFQRNGPYAFKPLLDNWKMPVLASGNAGWFRLINEDEPYAESYEAQRIDGAISATPNTAEWTIPTIALVAGTSIQLESFTYTIPPLVTP